MDKPLTGYVSLVTKQPCIFSVVESIIHSINLVSVKYGYKPMVFYIAGNI